MGELVPDARHEPGGRAGRLHQGLPTRPLTAVCLCVSTRKRNLGPCSLPSKGHMTIDRIEWLPKVLGCTSKETIAKARLGKRPCRSA